MPSPSGTTLVSNAGSSRAVVKYSAIPRDPDLDAESRGIAEYLTTVRDDPAFETSVVPLGEGIAVSYRR